MSTRWGVIVAGIAAFLLTACAPSLAAPLRPAPGATRLPSRILPLRRVGVPHAVAGGTVTSSENWAGYDVTGGGFTSVSASWVQPTVQPDYSGTQRLSSFWVGLDGDGSSTVEQCGTAADTVYGTVTNYAWWEMYPGYEQRIPGLTVDPGDRISATVTTDGAGDYTLTVANESTGATFTTTQYSATAYNYSAEVIAEAPSLGYSVQPLADFGSVSFSACQIDGRPLGSYGWNRIDMASNGTTLAGTLALDSSGTAFTISTGGSDTTPPVTTVSGADDAWHRVPVTLTFSATDTGGSGVASTEYSLDGGSSWTQGASLTIPAPADHSNDGAHPVEYRSIDNAGNVETAHTCTVRIDTLGPVCAARNANVRRGRSTRLHFKVHDALSPEVTRTLIVSTASGVAKKRWSWSYGTDSGGWSSISFRCNLAKGAYVLSVYGADLAGNAQSVVGRASLRVR